MAMNRGQLLLITALAVALAIVASVSLLNSIYTPTGVDSSKIKSDTQTLERTHEEFKTGLREYVLREDSSFQEFGQPLPYVNTTLTTNATIQEDTQRIKRLYNRQLNDVSGSTIDVRYDSEASTYGDIVVQNRSTHVTNQNGPGGDTGDWNMFKNVTTVPRFSMNVTDVSTDETRFVVDQYNAHNWSLAINETGLYVKGDAVTNRSLCNLDGTDITGSTIDLYSGSGSPTVRLDGGGTQTCGTLRLGQNVSAPFNISVEQGENIDAAYFISAGGTDDEQALFANASFILDPTTQPQAKAKRADNQVLINPAIEFRYVTADMTYNGTFKLYSRGGS